MKGPIQLETHLPQKRERREKEATLDPFHQITYEERGTAAPPPSPSSPLSLAIDPTCTLDLIKIGGIVRLFDIDLKNFYTIFMIDDLIMCE
jgi:hypothetical protein